MSTLLDNLVENLQRQISSGNSDVRIDPEVLEDFYRDFAVNEQQAMEVPKQTESSAPAPIAASIQAPPTEAVSAIPTEPVKAEQKPVVPESTAPQQSQPFTAPVSQTAVPPSQDNVDINNLSLDELRSQGNTCSACQFSLGEKRSQETAVNPRAKLMIISEPAGRSEEQMSDPFHGEAGALLLKMVGAMNIDLAEIYMCMAHRCYGPGAREKIIETKPYLLKQVELVNPEVILIFGGAALNILLGEQSLMNNRGRWLEIGNTPVMATFPPAYLVHKAEAKKDAWKDMQQVMARLQV